MRALGKLKLLAVASLLQASCHPDGSCTRATSPHPLRSPSICLKLFCFLGDSGRLATLPSNGYPVLLLMCPDNLEGKVYSGAGSQIDLQLGDAPTGKNVSFFFL